MIKLYSLYDGWLLTEITPLVKQVQWSGSITQPARKITFNMVYPITDDNQPRVQIGPGTLISIVDSDTHKEIFRGQVIDRTLDSTNQEETFTVVDYLRFFMISKDSMPAVIRSRRGRRNNGSLLAAAGEQEQNQRGQTKRRISFHNGGYFTPQTGYLFTLCCVSCLTCVPSASIV